LECAYGADPNDFSPGRWDAGIDTRHRRLPQHAWIWNALDDIAEGLSVAFSLASQITGNDFSSLKVKTDAFVSEVRGDADLRLLFDEALGRMATATSG